MPDDWFDQHKPQKVGPVVPESQDWFEQNKPQASPAPIAQPSERPGFWSGFGAGINPINQAERFITGLYTHPLDSALSLISPPNPAQIISRIATAENPRAELGDYYGGGALNMALALAGEKGMPLARDLSGAVGSGLTKAFPKISAGVKAAGEGLQKSAMRKQIAAMPRALDYPFASELKYLPEVTPNSQALQAMIAAAEQPMPEFPEGLGMPRAPRPPAQRVEVMPPQLPDLSPIPGTLPSGRVPGPAALAPKPPRAPLWQGMQETGAPLGALPATSPVQPIRQAAPAPLTAPPKVPFQLKPGEGTHLNLEELQPGAVPAKADYANQARKLWAGHMLRAMQAKGINAAKFGSMTQAEVDALAKEIGLNASSPEKLRILMSKLTE